MSAITLGVMVEKHPRASASRRAFKILASAALIAVATTSCSKCGPRGAETTSSTEPAEPPVPAPPGLLADVYFPAPNVFWSKLQRGIGGPVGILPNAVGGLAALGLGLDPSVGDEIDGSLPAFGALTGELDDPRWAFALKLRDPKHARSVLFEGDVARFEAKEHDGLTEMVAKGGASMTDYGIALTKSGYLVVARGSPDLTTLSPYLTRTLPSKPAPSEAIVVDAMHDAVVTRLAPRLATLWSAMKQGLLEQAESEKQRHDGRAADFGDPKAVVALADEFVTRGFDVFKDMDRVRLAFDVDDTGAVITTTFTPSAGGGPATKWVTGMKTGDTAPLAALPIESAIGVLSRDSAEDRALQITRLEQSLATVLGSRLGEAETKKLHDVLEASSKARGDVLTAAVLWDGPQGVIVRTTGDASSGRQAIDGSLELARGPKIEDLLHLRAVKTRSEDVDGLGKVQFATFFPRIEATNPRDRKAVTPASFDKSGAKGAPSPNKTPDGNAAGGASDNSLSVAWADVGGGLLVAAAKEPLVPLRLGAKPERTLGSEAAVMSVLTPLGSDASTVVLVQPLKFDPERANLPVAPLVFAVGRHGNEGFMRYTISNAVLREVSRNFVGGR